MIRAEQLATPQPDGEDWYANLLVLDRRKCLLLTHPSTLFTVFEPDVRAAAHASDPTTSWSNSPSASCSTRPSPSTLWTPE